MAGFNKIVLLGNLTRDVEIRYSPNGTAVANFGLAVNRRYRQDDEQREEVCYVDIVVFGRQAKNVGDYLTKGSLALIEGRLQCRRWETPEGQKRSKHDVIANNVQFMPRTSGGDNGASYQPQRPAAASPPPMGHPSAPMMGGGGSGDYDDSFPPPDDDDIPFLRPDLSDRYLCGDQPPDMRA
jgi:single-strand DNA-binding protein